MHKLCTSALTWALLVGAPLSAALADDEEGGGQSQAGSEEGGSGSQAELGVKVAAKVGAGEQEGEAKKIQAQGQRLSSRLQKMLDAARQKGDIIHVVCLNDKLTQSNAAGRSVDKRVQALVDALKRADNESADHEFTVITVLGQKFVVLDREANQCVGQDVYEPGAAQVVTTINVNAPTDIDPTTPVPPAPAPPTVTIPPPISPAS